MKQFVLKGHLAVGRKQEKVFVCSSMLHTPCSSRSLAINPIQTFAHVTINLLYSDTIVYTCGVAAGIVGVAHSGYETSERQTRVPDPCETPLRRTSVCENKEDSFISQQSSSQSLGA